MAKARGRVQLGLDGVWEKIQDALSEKGIEIDLGGEGFEVSGTDEGEDSPVRVVCVKAGVKESVEELGRQPRDQVVMVRVGEDTAKDLDAWVQTGAVKSRSEAAALFIREGLRMRAAELARLREALEDVEAAQERLREKAREVFGDR